jgi:hypothetical protein
MLPRAPTMILPNQVMTHEGIGHSGTFCYQLRHEDTGEKSLRTNLAWAVYVWRHEYHLTKRGRSPAAPRCRGAFTMRIKEPKRGFLSQPADLIIVSHVISIRVK